MSDEIKAQQKYNCPSCGAEAQWNPAKQALVCPFCGTVSPAKLGATHREVYHWRIASRTCGSGSLNSSRLSGRIGRVC